jgi:hypothetical protein
LSQAQFAHLLPVFSDIYQTTQQQTYEQGVESGTGAIPTFRSTCETGRVPERKAQRS